MSDFSCACNALLIDSCYTDEYKVIQKGNFMPASLISQREIEQPVPGLNRLTSFMPKKALVNANFRRYCQLNALKRLLFCTSGEERPFFVLFCSDSFPKEAKKAFEWGKLIKRNEQVDNTSESLCRWEQWCLLRMLTLSHMMCFPIKPIAKVTIPEQWHVSFHDHSASTFEDPGCITTAGMLLAHSGYPPIQE